MLKQRYNRIMTQIQLLTLNKHDYEKCIGSGNKNRMGL